MQAARGTPLSRDDSGLTDQPPAPSRGRALGVLFGTFGLLYAADQVTKVLAVRLLTGEPDKPLVGELLQLHLTRNPGAAFSTGTAFTEVFSVLAIVATLVILYLSGRVRSAFWAFSLGLLLAGITGNLTDRLLRAPGVLRGHVVDFLMLPNWPVFNLADICINAGAVLILVQAFRGVRLDGTRIKDEERGAEEEGA
jgi:signal peptidase II